MCLHWPAAVQAIDLALGDFFSGEPGKFIVQNLRAYWYTVGGKMHVTSMLLLLFTANGIFEPLEVALNRAWGVTENRSYLRNQLISLGLIFACGGLALLSLMLTALDTRWIAQSSWRTRISVEFPETASSLKSPHFRSRFSRSSWSTGCCPTAPSSRPAWRPSQSGWDWLLKALKYLNMLIAPTLQAKFHHEYFIFEHSVTILVWSFVAALVVLAGAHWTARHGRQDPLS